MKFRIAKQADKEAVLTLYKNARAGRFCVWNDTYPGLREIEQDLQTSNLYVLTEGNSVIGAISIVPENELDNFDCWSCKNSREIARVVIRTTHQGQRLAFKMVEQLISIFQKTGCGGIHLSVVNSNLPAYKTYINAGFTVVGEAQMYGNDYFLMEKPL